VYFLRSQPENLISDLHARDMIEIPKTYGRVRWASRLTRWASRKPDSRGAPSITFWSALPNSAVSGEHQDAIDKQGLLLCDIQIGKRRMRARGRARDPNRQWVFHRSLSDTVRGALMNGCDAIISRPLCRYPSR
jgi:hypothetical protein